jgi:ABC-type dipeptide/oligopeptide/nickel transport system ATPase subunit
MISNIEKELLFMHRLGMNFILIREPENWESALDVDILVNDKGGASEILIENGYFCYRDSGTHSWFLKYNVTIKKWMHIDMHHGLKFGDIDFPMKYIHRLFDKSVPNKIGIPILNEGDHLILLFFHSVIDKNNIDGKYKKKFNIDLGVKIFEALKMHYDFLPKPLGYYIQQMEKWRKKDITSAELMTPIRIQFGLDSDKSSVMAGLMLRVKKRVKGLFRGGNMITVLGPDGSGKSTITDAISILPNVSVKLQYMGPVPNLNTRTVFILEKLLMALNNQKRNFSTSSIFGKVIRVLWHISNYIDLIVRVNRNIWHASGDGIVVFDRYACDMFIRDEKHINESVYIKFFPKPKKVVLCIGSAIDINYRKPELEINEINQAIDSYKLIFNKHKIPFTEINTTKNSIKESVDILAKILLKEKFSNN